MHWRSLSPSLGSNDAGRCLFQDDLSNAPTSLSLGGSLAPACLGDGARRPHQALTIRCCLETVSIGD